MKIYGRYQRINKNNSSCFIGLFHYKLCVTNMIIKISEMYLIKIFFLIFFSFKTIRRKLHSSDIQLQKDEKFQIILIAQSIILSKI
jgi:hypothetical protein